MAMKSLPQTRRLRVDAAVLWVAVIVFSFVFRAYILLDPTKEPVYQLLYSLLYVAFATEALHSKAFCTHRGFLLLIACFFWAAFSCALHSYEEREVMQLASYFLTMIFAFFVCYPLAFSLNEARMRRAFTLICAVYLALMAGLGCVGVYVTATDASIPSLAGPGYISANTDGTRLIPFVYPTAAATFFCLALLVGLYLLLRAKRFFARIACALAMLIVFVALALTDSRTSSIFFSACLAGFFYLLSDGLLPIPKRPVRLIAALCVAAAAFALCYGAQRLSYRAIFSLAAPRAEQSAAQSFQPEPLPAVQATRLSHSASAALHPAPAATPAPAAEPKAESSPAPRALFENLSTLQGRTYVWSAAIRALAAEPRLLFTGSSPLFVMDAVNPYVEQLYGGVPFVHLHSIVFQTLVAFGLPGLLLFGALIAYILFHAIRLFFCGRASCSLCERTLPLLLFYCLAVDMMETFLSFSDVMRYSNPWFFLVGGYVVFLSSTRIKKGAHPRAVAAGVPSGKVKKA